MNARLTLLEAIETLPEERISQIADFVEFIRQREELRKRNWQVTVDAMEAGRRGEGVTIDDIDGLRAYLHADEDVDALQKDYRRETKGKSTAYVDKLDTEFSAIVAVLLADKTLQERHRDHALSGDWKDHRGCHVRPDLVFIYCKKDDSTLELVRLGSHSELGLS